MKKLILSFVLLAFAATAMAQIDLGPRITVTSTALSVKETVNGLSSGDAGFGYQVGAFARVKVPILGLYVQPEVLWSSPASQLKQGAEEFDINFNQVDVPVMVGLSLGPVRLNAGPSFRFLSKAESKDSSGNVEDVSDFYKKSTVGYQAGVGIDVLKFVFDLKYEGSFGSIVEDTNINGDQRINQWVFGVGYKLF
jgi:hypothetical protein